MKVFNNLLKTNTLNAFQQGFGVGFKRVLNTFHRVFNSHMEKNRNYKKYMQGKMHTCQTLIFKTVYFI